MENIFKLNYHELLKQVRKAQIWNGWNVLTIVGTERRLNEIVNYLAEIYVSAKEIEIKKFKNGASVEFPNGSKIFVLLKEEKATSRTNCILYDEIIPTKELEENYLPLVKKFDYSNNIKEV